VYHEKTEVKQFETLYERHLQKLTLQGKSAKTIDAYARAVRRLVSYFDRCSDKVSVPELEDYFQKKGFIFMTLAAVNKKAGKIILSPFRPLFCHFI